MARSGIDASTRACCYGVRHEEQRRAGKASCLALPQAAVVAVKSQGNADESSWACSAEGGCGGLGVGLTVRVRRIQRGGMP